MKRLLVASGLVLGTTVAVAAGFTVSSPDLAPNQKIGQKFVFNSFGCTGENVSPALNWKNTPAGTKSFAVTVHDPDAPTGGAGFWHWVVINLPATMTGLAQGDGVVDSKNLPQGATQIHNDYGLAGWGGPCPPVGNKPHRYNFTVYALKVDKLVIPADASTAVVGFMINQNALGKATLTARYGR
ncbi:MAG: YbhB/YbcL family Raf kinase inhibitor-like protein [Sulfuriferula sp.]